MKLNNIALASTLALAAVSLNSNAKYIVEQTEDPMTDSVQVYATDVNYKTEMGLRCDSGNRLMLTFTSMDYVATPNDTVQLRVRVDKNAPFELDARTFNNSWKAGFVRDPDMELVKELMSGSKGIVQVFNYGQLKSQFKLRLSGTASAFSTVLGACGLSLK